MEEKRNGAMERAIKELMANDPDAISKLAKAFGEKTAREIADEELGRRRLEVDAKFFFGMEPGESEKEALERFRKLMWECTHDRVVNDGIDFDYAIVGFEEKRM